MPINPQKWLMKTNNKWLTKKTEDRGDPSPTVRNWFRIRPFQRFSLAFSSSPDPGLDFCLSRFTDNSDTAGINMEHCCNIVTFNQSPFDLWTLKDQMSKLLWFSDMSLVVLLIQTTNRRFLGPQCCVHSLNSFPWSWAPRWTKETTMDPR